MDLSDSVIRPAAQSDVPEIAECVRLAYEKYVPLLGMKPNPMLEDYREVVERTRVSVLIVENRLAGVVVLEVTDEGFLLNNIAVHPSQTGKGFGSQLLCFAEQEAIRNGFESMYLYTNVKMLQNQAIYAARGFVEYARREVNGRHGVFMRKTFPAEPS